MTPVTRARIRNRFFGIAVGAPAGPPTLSFDFINSQTLSPQITFTRASTATFFNSAGVLQSAANDVARFDFNPATLAAQGLLIEEQRTNFLLHNRDLVNAAWVATNITPAKTETGIDGVANSASLITATAGNGTIIQAVTSASAARFTSAYVKRVTGTGTIEMTQDGGTNWSSVTVTSGWTRVSIASATVTNPSVGFRIVTNGDAIAVDGVQLENGAFATSVIFTAGASATRNADVAVVAGTNFSTRYNAVEGSLYAEGSTFSTYTAAALATIDNGTTNNRMTLRRSVVGSQSTLRMVSSGGSIDVSLASGTALGVNKLAFAAAASNQNAASNGTLFTGIVSITPMPTVNQLQLGAGPGSFILNGWLRRVTYYPRRLSNAELQAITA